MTVGFLPTPFAVFKTPQNEQAAWLAAVLEQKLHDVSHAPPSAQLADRIASFPSVLYACSRSNLSGLAPQFAAIMAARNAASAFFKTIRPTLSAGVES